MTILPSSSWKIPPLLKPSATRAADVREADIGTAVYDLKTVNPHIKAATDTRTVLEIIDNINLQGQLVTTAMANLCDLLAED